MPILKHPSRVRSDRRHASASIGESLGNGAAVRSPGSRLVCGDGEWGLLRATDVFDEHDPFSGNERSFVISYKWSEAWYVVDLQAYRTERARAQRLQRSPGFNFCLLNPSVPIAARAIGRGRWVSSDRAIARTFDGQGARSRIKIAAVPRHKLQNFCKLTWFSPLRSYSARYLLGRRSKFGAAQFVASVFGNGVPLAN